MEKVLIIEDDELIAELERDYLEAGGFQVEIALDGTTGLQKAQTEEYGTVVLDVMLPGKNGFEICRELRRNQDLPIIMVTARREDVDKIRGLGLGADDYLTKPYQLEELWARILVQLRHASAVPAETSLRYRDWTLNLEEMTLTAAGQPVNLTAHEFKIVELLAGRPKRVFTKQQIYEAVWQEAYAVEDKTITVHISNIRAKLRPSGTDSYIQTVWGIGFKLAE